MLVDLKDNDIFYPLTIKSRVTLFGDTCHPFPDLNLYSYGPKDVEVLHYSSHINN